MKIVQTIAAEGKLWLIKQDATGFSIWRDDMDGSSLAFLGDGYATLKEVGDVLMNNIRRLRAK